jgi:arginine-tRNA-protein transferase
MKIVFSEYLAEYSTYTFSYAVYCLLEHVDELPEIYARGFLPYTGDPTLNHTVFYLARSVRVDLHRFHDTSENRRIDRKVQPLEIEVLVTEISAFDTAHPKFVKFCTKYTAERFSDSNMDEERLRYVLSRQALTHIFTFHSKGHLLGYVFACLSGKILHYWYAFFNTDYLKTHSLGKWMMWKTIRWAKDRGLQHVYLGTCYGEKALYKVRDHRGAEFFDGSAWNTDMYLLKSLCQHDTSGPQRNHDAFKSPDDEERKIFHHLFT